MYEKYFLPNFRSDFYVMPNMLSIVNVKGETYKDEYSAINNNLKIIWEPIYKETSHQSSNSIVLNVEEWNVKTQNSYIASGILKDVRNVTL